MKVVNVGELKKRLGHYLKVVRQGEPVLVRDRDVVIARIEPAGAIAAGEGKDEERLARLERRGVIRRGKGRTTLEMPARLVGPERPGNVVGALLADREEGR